MNHSLISTEKIIDLDTCLQNKYAFWYADSKVDVFLTNFPDSIFSQTTTDSLGYFRAKIPSNEECYIKIEGAGWQWGEEHLPLFIRNIKQGYSIKIPFIPFLRSMSTIGEYVAVKQKRKFPFQKKRWKLVHNPPEMMNVYSPGNYTFQYKAHRCILTNHPEGSEIDFAILAHDVIKLDEQRIITRFADRGIILQEHTLQERFPGGEASFQRFIDKFRKSPQKPPKDSINYQVKISCIVDAVGSVSYPLISKSSDPWHDQEALRLIGLIGKIPRLLPNRSRDPVSKHLIIIDINFSYPR
ncbi:hypothetical protein QQ008_22750 [Fulvivirgaceae bacterium BMA10]|uniref:TonB C-terminal domain-containing protein n=1 Tax=Splendidivirga corallicola TaxID=3051826 RepID=A0ABT8KTY6_9BACT|nr:hypothetical protein [Fulvivirgaceae bacterium BMA10]